jgi:hypothetical protein
MARLILKELLLSNASFENNYFEPHQKHRNIRKHRTLFTDSLCAYVPMILMRFNILFLPGF